MKRSKTWIIAAVLLGASALAACAPAGVEEPSAQVDEQSPAEVERSASPTPAAEAVDDSTQSPTETAAPVEVEPVATPRAELSASDPTTFVRASGKPQVVEFFAYW